MDKRALSVPSPFGGGDNKPKTALSFHIIDHQQFIDSVIGGHSYDYSEEAKCKVDNLHGIVKNIISVATQFVDGENVPKGDLSKAPGINISSDILQLIECINCQMTCQAKEFKNMEETWKAIFQKLRSYRWTTQVLLVLAAFALQYGDFWYASEAPPEGRNAMSDYLWKALRSLKKKVISDGNKVAIKPLNDVVKDLCELTTSLSDLTQLVYQYRGKHLPELARAFQSIPRWSCETIIAILAAANIFAQTISVSTMFITSELENLKLSVSDRRKAVRLAVTACKEQIGNMEEYQKYVKDVEAAVDIADFLRLLLADDSKQNPFAPGPSNKPVKYELFRKKIVLLIISGQKIPEFDIAIIESIHKGRQESPKGGIVPIQMESESQKKKVEETVTVSETRYELVWIPIVDAGQDKLEALPSFESVRPWAFVVDPRKMNKFAARYIKEEWHFKRETMVVVLDSLGWVENTDAMPMLRLRETDAFPYTGNESTRLWRGRRNWFQLLLSEPESTLDAVKDEYILFSGGLPAVEVAGDARDGVRNFKEVLIDDMKHFRILLRSCLITRLQDLQIQKKGGDALLDRMVYEMSEVYRACRRGGVAILTKRQDLELRLVGLSSDLRLVRDQAKDGWTDLAKGFEKKYEDAQQQSKCLHVCVPQFPDLEDLYCPLCNQLMDLCLECCHSDSD